MNNLRSFGTIYVAVDAIPIFSLFSSQQEGYDLEYRAQ
jgi:hypothetical protein